MNFHDKNIYELIAIEEYIKYLFANRENIDYLIETDREEIQKSIEKKSTEMYKAYHTEEDYDYLTG